MGRYYQLSKIVTKEESSEIVRKMEEVPDIEQIAVTKDSKFLFVETRDNVYTDVMNRAVNICRHVADGCELSFSRFAY